MTAPRTSKIASLTEVVGEIRNGSSLTAGGFAHSHQPLGFLRALLRRQPRELVLMGVAECWVAELLAATGSLRRTYMSNFMFEGLGRCRQFSEGVESGAIEVEDHSHFGMISRLVAAGIGLPFMPLRSMAGSDILEQSGFEAKELKWQLVRSPFGGEPVVAVSPLAPDFAVIHAARADHLGNVQLFGATSAIEEQVRAARRVFVTVEEIVDTSVIRSAPELTLIPGFAVDAVVHLPYGAHPTGVYGYYDHDAAFLRRYYDASRDKDALVRHLDEFVFGPSDHWAYLDKIGIAALLSLRVDPALGYCSARVR